MHAAMERASLVMFLDLGVTGEVYIVIGGNALSGYGRLLNTKSRKSGRLNRVNQLTKKGIKYSKITSQHKPEL